MIHWFGVKETRGQGSDFKLNTIDSEFLKIKCIRIQIDLVMRSKKNKINKKKEKKDYTLSMICMTY